MEHIRILTTIVALVTGTGAIVYAVQLIKSHSYPFLKSLAAHIVCYNACLVLFLFAKYTDVNMPGQFPFSASPLYAETGEFLFSLLVFAMSFCMFRIYAGFRIKPVPGFYNKSYIVLAFLVLFSLVIEKLVTAETPVATLLDNFRESLIDVVFLLELLWLIVIRFGDRNSPDRNKKRIAKIFAYLYLSRYLLFIMISIFPGTARYFLIMASMIYFNIIPIIWLRFVFLPFTRGIQKTAEGHSFLETICRNHNISRREQEILNLLLKGKSNKEIEDALYISIHTVKNHIYSIYKKLGVKNRYQLVHFITRGDK